MRGGSEGVAEFDRVGTTIRKGILMKRWVVVITVALALGLLTTGMAMAQTATKEECVAKCKEAADMVNKQGLEAAIAEINKKDGKFVWKDTYVFLMDMSGKMLAHPMSPALLQKTAQELLDMKDKAGKAFFGDFIKAAKSEKGEGWVEYMWPKPGATDASPKDTYIYKVPGKDLFCGAGIYK